MPRTMLKTIDVKVYCADCDWRHFGPTLVNAGPAARVHARGHQHLVIVTRIQRRHIDGRPPATQETTQ
jgi:hypothetical protein